MVYLVISESTVKDFFYNFRRLGRPYASLSNIVVELDEQTLVELEILEPAFEHLRHFSLQPLLIPKKRKFKEILFLQRKLFAFFPMRRPIYHHLHVSLIYLLQLVISHQHA